ncbi:hypothetical protein DIPPA_02895 [Diplonema papillatum]|nr:hypothetical protein DIPPA_02895 [Diplonema papillatum]
MSEASSRPPSSDKGGSRSAHSGSSTASSGRRTQHRPNAEELSELGMLRHCSSGMVGTSLSRFLGFYNPAFDKPSQKKCDVVDMGSPELRQRLHDEAAEAGKAVNRKKDWMKEYLDEQVRYACVNKVTSVRQ